MMNSSGGIGTRSQSGVARRPRSSTPRLTALTFAGSTLGPQLPDVVDKSLTHPLLYITPLYCTMYRFDVTSLVAGNGSFGLENDYVRVARECLGCSTETVAFVMLVVTVAALALAFLLACLFPAPDR